MLRSGLAVAGFVVLLWLPGSAWAQPTTPAIMLTATPSSVFSGQRVMLSGRTANTPPGSEVQLYANPYPYRRSAPVAATHTSADGSFSFTLTP